MKAQRASHKAPGGKTKKASKPVALKPGTGSDPPVSQVHAAHGNQAMVRMVDRAAQHPPAGTGDLVASPGHPLEIVTRQLMEARLGHQFDEVQIHTDARAAEQARALGAHAFTVEQHIVFNEGAYQPGTARGQELLAHELAHAAQPRAPGQQLVSKPGDASEREADRAARSVADGESMRVGGVAGAAIQRQALPGVMSGKLDPPSPDGLLENASPLLASALGSATLDDFDTGKTQLKREHERRLTSVAHAIDVLLRKYGTSTIDVIGFADTVGTEAKNLGLGQNRADVVKQALIDRGVPAGIIAATSKGEGGPQAAPTQDDVPSAANRRVEIRFHPGKSYPGVMGGTLTRPDPTKTGPKPTDLFGPGGINIIPKPGTLKPEPEPGPEPSPPPPDYFKPIPPPIKGSGPKSVVDVVSEGIINPTVDRIFGGLSKSKRDWLKEKGREAVESGIPSLARKAAEAVGVSDSGALGGFEKAVEAAIKEKGEREKPVDDRNRRLPPEPRNP